ncbi:MULTISPECIES: flagellar basal-body rod protein FlgG [Yersinia pseudotuberculosis complex]|uniref:Flagellar basal-body rod protein FlgG n=1 Tax=Yersinia similis TaxID=367190 RepID=A0A0T9RCU0_9GAMM|nr:MULTISPECIES: flagellar basal-body rod protein FlgG [Yersinia pseudotuberculosis complex]AHK18570.1 flagellar basal body rod protein FlgG [Yersinia similis]AJK15060.1 flagellar basal-body rod protein FlgG [Yersinia pseudotuberculosis str. PA3606]CFQ70281.1 flagellar basal body rod protein FlgG [Yersinia similis]CFV33942.1 flagellar basal body rod protein FlgG [Yersinia pseudotuberculosis]CNC29137.1 flagellar basal body rod protein FlgG [Yersinia similis]
MNSALWVSKTGLAAQDAKMGAISNNLANVNTDGFKRDRVVFADLFYQNQRTPGAPLDQNNTTPSGIQFGSGVQIVGTQKQFTVGSIKVTKGDMDVAISGQGFFQIETLDGGMAYTRAGNLTTNADGVLVNAQGMPLIPQIELPAGSKQLHIGKDGTVSATVGGETEPVEIGQITLVNFVNPAGLEAIGGNLYKETAASGEAVEGVPGEEAFGQLEQGALEGSNVQVVEEMVDMITVQRAYEMNAKMVSAADDMLKFVSQKL